MHKATFHTDHRPEVSPMAVDADTDFLTIAEAASLLKVSKVTIQRWLKQGRLPAYHVGPRAVRIRRADLRSVLTPVAGEGVSAMRETTPIQTDLTIRPLTEAEVKQRLAALDEARTLREQMLARRGGKPLAPSWPLIRQAREERAQRL